jgi:hypothetical protein
MKTQIVTTKTGRKMHYYEGKLVTKDVFEASMQNDPQNLDVTVEEITTTTTSTTTLPPTTPTDRVCLFCGAYGDTTKYVNMRIVYLCNNHYLTKTTGEIAEQLNKP